MARDTKKLQKATENLQNERPSDARGSKPGEFGQPPHVATEKNKAIVKAFVVSGAKQATIAHVLGISEDTLQRHYREELDISLEQAMSDLAGVMMRRAHDDEHKDCQRAAEYIMSRRGGAAWKDKLEHDVAGGIKIDITKRVVDADAEN